MPGFRSRNPPGLRGLFFDTGCSSRQTKIQAETAQLAGKETAAAYANEGVRLEELGLGGELSDLVVYVFCGCVPQTTYLSG